jgi:hypothetical protein
MKFTRQHFKHNVLFRPHFLSTPCAVKSLVVAGDITSRGERLTQDGLRGYGPSI